MFYLKSLSLSTQISIVVYYNQSFIHKELYEAPSTSVVDVRFEGIICQSGGLNSMGDPEDL